MDPETIKTCIRCGASFTPYTNRVPPERQRVCPACFLLALDKLGLEADAAEGPEELCPPIAPGHYLERRPDGTQTLWALRAVEDAEAALLADTRTEATGCEPCPGGNHYRAKGEQCKLTGCAFGPVPRFKSLIEQWPLRPRPIAYQPDGSVVVGVDLLAAPDAAPSPSPFAAAVASGRLTQHQAERASWTWGNCAISNPDVTPEIAIQAVLDKDAAPSTPPASEPDRFAPVLDRWRRGVPLTADDVAVAMNYAVRARRRAGDEEPTPRKLPGTWCGVPGCARLDAHEPPACRIPAELAADAGLVEALRHPAFLAWLRLVLPRDGRLAHYEDAWRRIPEEARKALAEFAQPRDEGEKG